MSCGYRGGGKAHDRLYDAGSRWYCRPYQNGTGGADAARCVAADAGKAPPGLPGVRRRRRMPAAELNLCLWDRLSGVRCRGNRENGTGHGYAAHPPVAQQMRHVSAVCPSLYRNSRMPRSGYRGQGTRLHDCGRQSGLLHFLWRMPLGVSGGGLNRELEPHQGEDVAAGEGTDHVYLLRLWVSTGAQYRWGKDHRQGHHR